MNLKLISNHRLRAPLLALLWLIAGQSIVLAGNKGIPVITTSPASVATCPGNNVKFSVTATGNAPLSYYWRKNTIPIPGATNTIYNIAAVTASDAGSYNVVVSNTVGTATSAAATLTVNTPPVASALTNLVRSVGASAVFSTTASGTGPFSYGWDKDGIVIAGQTNSSLILSNLSLSDLGVYRVTVSGACGSTSSSATLTVDSCFPAVDVMLVIDRSGSMAGQKYNDARQACSNFVQNLNFSANADQAGLASYNSAATLDQKLTNSLQALDQSIHSIPAAAGNTSISLGLHTAQAELVSARHNPQALPVLILLSDGLPTGTDTKSNALYNATLAKDAGTLVFTVGLGSDVDPVLMAGIASAPEDYFFTTNSSQLSVLFNAISTLICRPPTNIFVGGLSNLTVCAGSEANFAVTVTATSPDCAPYSYQWEKDGVPIFGQTNTFLVVANVSAADAGAYAVEVSSVCRCVTNSASLVVNSPVLVVSAPVSLTNCPETSASFSVGATGTGLSYQWYNGGNALPGQTGSSLSLSSVGATDAGVYSVVVSGACGAAVTNSASLVVNSPVLVVSAPVSLTNCPGMSASFSVNATGTGLSYQWYKDGAALPGQTGSSLSLSSVGVTDAGAYSVVVSGTCGTVVTNSANLVVNSPVLVVSAPVSLTNCPGTSASFSVNATGTGLSYQWYKGGNALPGQIGSSLSLSGVGAADAGVYSVVVSGACGAAVTNSASLVVNNPVLVVSAPVSLTNCPGTSASFSVVATGTGLSYQWYKDGAALPGKIESGLSLSSVGPADAGAYSVVVGGTCGTAVTNAANLVVNSPVLVVSAPVSLTNCPGTSASFSVNAAGTGLSYQWYKGGSALPGQIGSSLSLSGVGVADAGFYSVVVSGACGIAVTNSASLVVNSPVLVVSAPVSLTNCPGTSASFSVSATGTGLSYQWYKGGSPLSGQTGSSLVLTNVSGSDTGGYSVVVTGACGDSQSVSASLTVNEQVVVVSAPESLTNCPGTSANFSVSATGTGLGYQMVQDWE